MRSVKEDKLDKFVISRELDLASVFDVLSIAADFIEKTAFVTPESHYEFLRMPFGLTNTPAIFQKLMVQVLNEGRPLSGLS